MKRELGNFEHKVKLKYNIYNSIFQTLGLDGIHKTGILLPLFSDYCKEQLAANEDPTDIVDSFFNINQSSGDAKSRIDMLFRFIQFIERQVVLVDSLEDAAYSEINDLEGKGSFKALFETLNNRDKLKELTEAFGQFKVRTVLTAHPTQFYPGQVLGIIRDLSEAIKGNQLDRIEVLLAQLGYTPFFKKQKPTPFDEATSLIWFLENIYYHSIPEIYKSIAQQMDWEIDEVIPYARMFQLGFWPGGDRDGNPFVTTEVTLKVAGRLRESICKCYYRDLRLLKRKVTFRGAEELLAEIELSIYEMAYKNSAIPLLAESVIIEKLKSIEDILEKRYGGIHKDQVAEFRLKFSTFGYYFATIDIRQDNDVIKEAFDEQISGSAFKEFDENELEQYFKADTPDCSKMSKDPIRNDTLDSFNAIRSIVETNGIYAAHRYIISNCNSAQSVGRVFMLARMMGWKGELNLDIIPLFETIVDLDNASATMRALYSIPAYMDHLTYRDEKQIIMLGFSDGTKDGGYLTANWSIYKAKEEITAVSREFGIKTVFFDGRGGPPARGGGNTHNFYASMGRDIESHEIQLTIQGQTISSNYGTTESARFNMEQLFTAGLENLIFDDEDKNLNKNERLLIEELSEISKKSYLDFKNHDKFISYLEERSALKYYSKANIGSRPSKRGKSDKLNLKDLRAIPFVGAWSQLKQNVPGFYGLGFALESFDQQGRIEEVKELYASSLFFRTLMENSMQSLCKTYFPLTQYLQNDPEYGEFWKIIHREYQVTVKYLLLVSGQKELLESNKSIQQSIRLRESIVLPLLVIQQYALKEIQKLERENATEGEKEIFEKLVIRSLYGNINASRNSA